ncbi:MAG: hypothetical protein H7844_04500 [Nitrospirae bacterium YQR-1]
MDELSLFDAPYMSKNRIIALIENLDFIKAKNETGIFRKAYPSMDIETESIICDFFVKHESLPEPEKLYSTWRDFERLIYNLELKIVYLPAIKKNYFKRLCLELDKQPDGILSINDEPVGLFYLYAERIKTAKQKLEKAIVQQSPNLSQLYGYLGYIHFLNKDLPASRICLREAFEIGPYGIDLYFLKDKEIMELINGLNAEYVTLHWIVSYGCIQRVFPPKTIKLLEDLRVYVNEFLELEKEYQKDNNDVIRARLFYKCLILSDNNKRLQHVGAVELTKLRKYMKDINPGLFKQYLAYVEENQGSVNSNSNSFV